MILALSAGFVGFIHSLSPGPWLPVVLMVKARKWHLAQAALAARLNASAPTLRQEAPFRAWPP